MPISEISAGDWFYKYWYWYIKWASNCHAFIGHAAAISATENAWPAYRYQFLWAFRVPQ